MPGSLFDQAFEGGHQVLEDVRAQVGIRLDVRLLFGLFQFLFEGLGVEVKHDLAEHLDKTTVGVISEARVVRQPGQALHCLVIQAEIEDRVHHAWHGELCPGTNRNQQWVAGVAQFFAGVLLNVMERFHSLIPETFWKVLPAGVIGITGLCCDGEAGRNRHTRASHLRTAGAFAAKEIFHVAIAFAEQVDPLRHNLTIIHTSQPGRERIVYLLPPKQPANVK